jgi:hypothetical protein
VRQSDEFHFVPMVSAQQVDAEEARDLPILDTLEDLGSQKLFVDVGVRRRCPAMPDA